MATLDEPVMGVSEEHLNRVITAYTAPQPGEIACIEAEGVLVAYASYPTVLIDDGTRQINWAAHLCRPATPYGEASYWRERAQRAEEALATARIRHPADDIIDLCRRGGGR